MSLQNSRTLRDSAHPSRAHPSRALRSRAVRSSAPSSRTVRLRAIRTGAVALALILAVAGCGSVDAIIDEAQAAAEEAESNSQDYGESNQRSGSVEFDPAVGWLATGPDGTTIDVHDTFSLNGGEDDQYNTYTLVDGERRWLYTAFVDAATVEMTVVSGGPVVFQLHIANLVEGGEFGEVNVTEIIETVELAEGETATLTGVRPGS